MWRCEGNGWVATCHVDGGNETKAMPDGLDWIERLSVWRQLRQHNYKTRQDKQVSKQSTQLNRACLCPLVLLCGPGYVAATESPALLCLLALRLGSKKRSAVFGTSVTEPRSPLDSILYTLFTFEFQPRERTNGPTNNNRPRQSISTHTHNNPSPNPNQQLHCAATARSPPLLSNHLTTTTSGTNQYSSLPPPSKS